MRKKYLSALLFGALIAAPTGTFVSCSEDYDDDITELRQQITTNATDISSLVDEKLRNSETEIAALKAQSEALATAYKDADKALEQAIKDATNDAQGYADIQAAEAQKAAIAAAQKLVDDAVASLQASVDAANATIEEQGRTIASLLEADKTLQEGISAAQASADKAYELAEQASKDAAAASQEAQAAKAAAAEVAENLNGVKDDLAKQTSVLGERIDAVLAQANANKAAIEAQATSIEELKAANEQALAALSEKDDELKALIEKNQADIAALETLITETAQSAADNALAAAKVYVDEAVNAVKAELAQTKTLAESAQAAADEAKTAANDAQTKADAAQRKADDAIAKAVDAVNKAIAAQGDAASAVAAAQAAQADATAAQTAATNAQTVANNAQTVANTAAADATEAKTLATQNKTDIASLKSAYETKVAEIEADIDAIDGRLTRNEGLVTQLQSAVGLINQSLIFNMNQLITSIIVQATNESGDGYNVYAKVVGQTDNIITKSGVQYVVFPYSAFNGRQELRLNWYNVQEYAGDIYATVNPTDIDASKVVFKLENSLDKESDRYVLGTAEPAQNVQITRSTSKNGLWAIPAKAKETLVSYNPGDPDNALYALTTEYPQDSIDLKTGETKRIMKKVVSHYAIEKNPHAATVAMEATLVGAGDKLDRNPGAGVDIQFSALAGQLSLGSKNVRVYKKFIECVKVEDSKGNAVENGAATFNAANEGVLGTILAADNLGKDETIDVNCPASYKNYKVTLKYYIWNYDGTIKTVEKVVVFNQTLWGPDNTAFTYKPTNGGAFNTAWSAEYPGFDFVTGVKSTNGTTWQQEAVTAEAQPARGSGDMITAGTTVQLYKNDKSTLVNNLTVGSGATALAAARGDIKQMRLNIADVSKLTVDKTYTVVVTFYDANGFKVNIVNIDFKLVIPDGTPDPWHIAAAFDAADKNTYAWANYQTADDTNANATYLFSGSFYKVTDGFTSVSPYIFKDNDTYGTLPGNQPVAYLPSQYPAHSTFNMIVPNKSVQDEHVYSMTAGIKFFGLENLVSYDAENGWNDVFNITFLSPIKYSILGTKERLTTGTLDPVKIKNPITVEYSNNKKLVSSMFEAYDPKEASGAPVNFFNNRDNRIVSTSLEFADNKDSNNALFSSIVENADHSWTLNTTDFVSMQSDATVNFKFTVTDVWGVNTSFVIPVTVKKNR